MAHPRTVVRFRACLTVLGLALLAGAASAQAPLIDGLGGTADYGPDGQCLSPNDDGSSAAIDMTPFFPAGLRFFDRTHTQVYVNTNGNITFSGPVSTFTPQAFPIADQPMIAPFWADVDIRRVGGTCMGTAGLTCTVCEPCHDPNDNGVWWYGEPGRMVFTWDDVGRFNCKVDRRMAFQLILTEVAAGCSGAGDFDVEFRFEECGYEVGDASGDENGNGTCEAGEEIRLGFPPRRVRCTPAQSGFDAGNRTDFVSIAGSMMPGIHTRLCTMSNVGEPGVWRFQIRSGTVMCPDAGDACDTGMAGVCATGRTNCVGMGTECVQDVAASAERCDALDNDCDGMVDESPDTLCSTGQTCLGGTCLATCFELGCPDGEVCLASGRCIDAECEGVTCPEGQRCEAGDCVGACEGVVCPHGRTCRGGACVDLCEGLTCDDCTVCVDGACATRCDLAACPSGEACLSDGRCVESACADVTCAAGAFCRAGECVDACEGAVCPDGQECRTGECVARDLPDAGPPPGRDAGPLAFDGGPRVDAGSGALDGGPDAGGATEAGGCGCRAAGAGGPTRAALVFALLALAGALRRRRG